MRRWHRGCRSVARHGSDAHLRRSPSMSPKRGNRPAWRGTAPDSGHFRHPDRRRVCCQSAVPDTRSSTRSTCSARNATTKGRQAWRYNGRESGAVLLCVLAKAIFGEHEGVGQPREDHIERLAKKRCGELQSIRSMVTITCISVHIDESDARRGSDRR